MGILTFTQPEPKKPKTRTQTPKCRPKTRKPDPNPTTKVVKQPSSWDNFKNLLTCKQIEGSLVHDPSKKAPIGPGIGYPKLTSSSCGSMCSFTGVVHGNTRRVVHRSDSSSPESSSLGQESGRSRLLARANHGSSCGSGSNRSLASSLSASSSVYSLSSRGMPLRKLSGCYECHMIVDPCRYPIVPRSTVCACSECGEIFPKIESLEHHQAVRHAVAELGGEDSGRNIVEIIFKSSWQKKEEPICKIERILKVKNRGRTIQRFEECRDVVKLRGNNNYNNNSKKNPRCAADGNELLRFHCTNLLCSLGSNGSTSLCSFSHCGVCSIIRHGFQGRQGVRTMASSGKAHDCLDMSSSNVPIRRAMLVCRVIAGRVRRSSPNNGAPMDDEERTPTVLDTTSVAPPYDSVAGSPGLYSSLEDLVVFNPRAILPCFVVIYNTISTT